MVIFADYEPIPVPRSRPVRWKRAVLYKPTLRYTRRPQLRVPFAVAVRASVAVFFKMRLEKGRTGPDLELHRVPRMLFAPTYAVVKGGSSLRGRVFLTLACTVFLVWSFTKVRALGEPGAGDFWINMLASGVIIAATLLTGTVAWPPIARAAARRASRKQAQPLLRETITSCGRLATRLARRYAAYSPVDFSIPRPGPVSVGELVAIREGGDHQITQDTGDLKALLDAIIWRSQLRSEHCHSADLRVWRDDLLKNARNCDSWTSFPTLELISIDALMRLGEQVADPVLVEICGRIDTARLDLLERDPNVRVRAIRALQRKGCLDIRNRAPSMVPYWRSPDDDIARWGDEMQRVTALARELRKFLVRLSNYMEEDWQVLGLSRDRDKD